MAGLLDMGFLSTPEAQAGLGLLAAGGGNMGNAIGAMLQQQQAAEERRLRREQQMLQQRLGNAQLANYQSEIDHRGLAAKKDERQQAMIQSMLGGMPGQPASAGQGGMEGGAQGGQQNIMGLAQQLGIPPQAIQADMVFNGGKKIAELLAERSKPNWQNVGGNLVNTNAPGFQGGFQDQVQMGPGGQVTALRNDGRGGLVTGAIPGSMQTYQAFQDISNRSSAANSPGRPVLGPDGRQYGQSQLSEIGGAPPAALMNNVGRTGPTNAAEQGMAAQVASVPYDVQREIAAVRQELPSITNPQDRAAAMAYLQNLQSQSRPQAAGVSSPAGALDFSPAEKAAQEAARASAIEQAKADVKPTDQRASGIANAQDMLKVIDTLQNHPGKGTATGMSGKVDPRNYLPGTDAKDFRVALDQLKGKAFLQAFESLKGGGAVSEIEGTKASNAMARLDTAQSDKAFNEALKDLRDVVESATARQKGSAARSGVDVGQTTEQRPAANRMVFDSKPPANQSNKGKILVGPDGKRYRSNGMQWTEE